jgi:hypothetical protein
MSSLTDGYHDDIEEALFSIPDDDDSQPEDENSDLDADDDLADDLRNQLGIGEEDDEDADSESRVDNSFMTNGIVTVSYVSKRFAFRNGDVTGAIFAYADQTLQSKNPGKIVIDGSKLYTNTADQDPIEIQLTEDDKLAFFNNESGELMAEVEQLYDDDGNTVDPINLNDDNESKVGLLINSDIVTTAPAPVSTVPRVRLPGSSTTATSSVAPTNSLPNWQLPSMETNGLPTTAYSNPSTWQPNSSSPRSSSITMLAPTISAPMPSNNTQPSVPSSNVTSSNGPIRVKIRIAGPSTSTPIVAPSTPGTNSMAGLSNIISTVPNSASRGEPSMMPLPGVKPINSYKDLLVKEPGETDAMYQYRAHLAAIIEDAPLYLLGINQQLTPNAIILISRMLNNRLWLKNKYESNYEEVLDLLCDICPELNGI